MVFSYNWLKDYLGGKTPEPKKLAELFTFHSFEVEGIEKVPGDWLINIDILPNRAHDCLSHLGVAMEAAVLANLKFKEPKLKFKEEKKKKASDFLWLEVKNEKDCPRYTAKVLLDVKVKPSPYWLQNRLTALGLQPINNIVDAVNYVMLETGQPMHAFDLAKINKKIIVRRAKEGEKIKCLDDKVYQLDPSILVIADQKELLAIAGIKGGKATGVDEKTKRIILEAANFDYGLIRNASQKLKLRTDASFRFENQISPNSIDYAQKRACQLIQETAGGKAAGGMLDFYPNKIRPKTIKLGLAHLNGLLGLSITKKEAVNILEKLDCRVKETKQNVLLVKAPLQRIDLVLPEDLIEEVGRIYGLQNIPSVFPRACLIPPNRNIQLFWQKISQNTLKELGFSEAYNYSFLGEKEKEIFNWSQHKIVEIEKPVSVLNKYLRPSLLPRLISNVKNNLKFFSEVKMFELGLVFQKEKKVAETTMLCGVLARQGGSDSLFYELKGALDVLLQALGLSDIWYDEVEPTPEASKLEHWHPGKRAEIKIGDREIGFLGQLNPFLLEKYNIKEKIFCFELDFTGILKLVDEEKEYQEISSYPSAQRDLALLVPEGTRMADVLNVIQGAGGELVRDVDLFDVYSGKGIGQEQENFAFHIIYQAPDRTLSSLEIDKAHQKITKALERKGEWEVRK